MSLRTVHGAESVHIASNRVEADITIIGGHVAPVTFDLGDKTVMPYSLPPWQPNDVPSTEPLLAALRGDFFCMPFGEQPDGPLHGEVANNRWTVERHADSFVELTMHAVDIDATVHRRISVADDQCALYQSMSSQGLQGRWNYGTHPIVDLSALPLGTGRLSTSAMRYRSVNPTIFSAPERGETQILEPGAQFDDLAAIPRMDGGTLDLSHYPTPPGHEDLVMLVNDPAHGPLGWSAMVFDDYAWIALKSIEQLPMTLLWISNGGRTASPWSGRHVGRMGIEDVCSYFAIGVESARDNELLDRGIPTSREFDTHHQLDVRTAHVVVPITPDFDIVSSVHTRRSGEIVVESGSGARVSAPVDWGFVLD